MARKKNGSAETEVEVVTIHEDDEAERIEAAADMAADTLTGDVRDRILEMLRFEQSKLPWDKRSEADQHDTVHRVEAFARDVVTKAVEIIASHGRMVINAYIEKAEVKDGIKAVVTLGRSDKHRHNLLDAVGTRVMIVLADADQFAGEQAPVEIKPDQSELPVDAGVVHSAADDNHGVPFH